MRQDPEYFGDQELRLIYIARKLKDALRLEEVLTAAGLDYAVETDTYGIGFLWRAKRTGAFFYVSPDVEAKAREVMTRNHYKPWLP